MRHCRPAAAKESLTTIGFPKRPQWRKAGAP